METFQPSKCINETFQICENVTNCILFAKYSLISFVSGVTIDSTNMKRFKFQKHFYEGG